MAGMKPLISSCLMVTSFRAGSSDWIWPLQREGPLFGRLGARGGDGQSEAKGEKNMSAHVF